MQKACRHPYKWAPTACRQMVSGSLSTPCSGYFSPFPHGTGSLSVSRKYLALPDGPGNFTQNSSCSALLRIPIVIKQTSRTGLSPSMDGFSNPFRSSVFIQKLGPITPITPKRYGFGLLRVRSPLLAESFIYFLFLRVLRCFSSPRSLPSNNNGFRGFTTEGCPIRKFVDLWLFAPTHNFSQLITSFFAFESLGIHHLPLITSLYLFFLPLFHSFDLIRIETYNLISLIKTKLHVPCSICQRSFVLIS